MRVNMTEKDKDRHDRRDYHLRSQFRFSLDEYESLLVKQNYACAICGRESGKFVRSLAVDHDHRTGDIRGLLCGRCNLALGSFKDNPLLLLAAITYLNKGKTMFPSNSIGWCERCGDSICEGDAMTVVRSAHDNDYLYHAACKPYNSTPDETIEE